MKINLDAIQKMIPETLDEFATGDDYLDAMYEDISKLIGHGTPYYLLFYLLAEVYKPKLFVELGSWRSCASAHVASASSETRVVTIDIHREDKIAQAITINTTKQYPNMTYINAWTWDAVENVRSVCENINHKIDVLFIDAWHEYQYAIKEWKCYLPLLADEALVICDDIMDAEGATVDMNKFWDEISEGYESFIDTGLHCGVPMGFIKFTRKHDNDK